MKMGAPKQQEQQQQESRWKPKVLPLDPNSSARNGIIRGKKGDKPLMGSLGGMGGVPGAALDNWRRTSLG
jgi:hypothetical protein